MPEIPAEAVQAALDALEAEDCNRTYFSFPEMARVAVEAAAPFIAEHIASLLAAVDPVEWALAGRHAGQDAARIAREAFPKETPDV